jgi:DNA repair protein RadA/Sms
VTLSGASERPLACFGELGLTGELRTVAHAERRVAEAAKFGLAPAMSPQTHGSLRAALAAALGTGARSVGRAA